MSDVSLLAFTVIKPPHPRHPSIRYYHPCLHPARSPTRSARASVAENNLRKNFGSSLLPAQYPFSGRKTCLMPRNPRIRRMKITSARRYSRYPAGWLHRQHVATNLAGYLVLFSHAHGALRGNALSCKPSESYDVPTRPFYR